MSRLLSVSLTEQAVVERRKTVTRRLGWWEDKNGRRLVLPGHELTLCRKVMGRKAGEPLVRLAQVGVVDVRREPLEAITDDDVAREGFDDQHRGPLILNDTGQPFTPAEWFVRWYAGAMRIERTRIVTRIEWEYLG